MKTLSIVIPAYNEAGTIEDALRAVCAALPEVGKQVVVVDDGSTDGTGEWLEKNLAEGSDFAAAAVPPGAAGAAFTVVRKPNGGKGSALRAGFAQCTGDVVVIQDADLEYDPADWKEMWSLIAQRGVADVVYGSRFYGRPHRSLNFHHFMANKLISWLFNLLYNQTLTDVEVCYKMFRRDVLHSLQLSADDFGIEIELSARIARQPGLRIYETGISYFGRTYAEGKKIRWTDGLKALGYLFRYRFDR